MDMIFIPALRYLSFVLLYSIKILPKKIDNSVLYPTDKETRMNLVLLSCKLISLINYKKSRFIMK